VKVLAVAIGIAYPFVVFLGLQWVSPRTLAAVVGLAVLARFVVQHRGGHWRSLAPLAGAAAVTGAFILVVAVLDDDRYLKALPVVVNIALFTVFARSLVAGPPMVERFARLQHDPLPPFAPPYCRRVTIVWCAFFALNALVILWLAVGASLTAWTIYTGVVAYVLAGTLFVAEVLYRAWRFRYYEDGAVDTVLRRIFPPRVGA
jgi:uncharacterized membrane protein